MRAAHVFPGPVAGRGVVAAHWVPSERLAGADGRLPRELVCAALDCAQLWALMLHSPPAMSDRVVTAMLDADRRTGHHRRAVRGLGLADRPRRPPLARRRSNPGGRRRGLRGGSPDGGGRHGSRRPARARPLGGGVGCRPVGAPPRLARCMVHRRPSPSSLRTACRSRRGHRRRCVMRRRSSRAAGSRSTPGPTAKRARSPRRLSRPGAPVGRVGPRTRVKLCGGLRVETNGVACSLPGGEGASLLTFRSRAAWGCPSLCEWTSPRRPVRSARHARRHGTSSGSLAPRPSRFGRSRRPRARRTSGSAPRDEVHAHVRDGGPLSRHRPIPGTLRRRVRSGDVARVGPTRPRDGVVWS